MRQGAIYKITCKTCESNHDVESCYIGESSRTLYDRGLEHLKAIQSLDTESPLVEHHLGAHREDEEPAFRMESLGFRSSALWRQAQEANEIAQHKAKRILNRRGEWGQNLPPKLSLEATEKVPFLKRKSPPPPTLETSPQGEPGQSLRPETTRQLHKKRKTEHISKSSQIPSDQSQNQATIDLTPSVNTTRHQIRPEEVHKRE